MTPLFAPPSLTWAARQVLVLGLGVALALAATAPAQALNDGAVVPRIVSFGGFCVKCDLSTRKLMGAHFVGAIFKGPPSWAPIFAAPHSWGRTSWPPISPTPTCAERR